MAKRRGSDAACASNRKEENAMKLSPPATANLHEEIEPRNFQHGSMLIDDNPILVLPRLAAAIEIGRAHV